MTTRIRILIGVSLLGGLGIASVLFWPIQLPTAPSAVTPPSSMPSLSLGAGTKLELLFPPSGHAEKLQKLPVTLAARFMRAEDEWQGMVHDPEEIWPCMPDGACSKARACIDGQCLPCTRDSECQNAELCVLGHCVRENQVECSTREDCDEPDALCLLTGYTPLDLRSNLDMRARCQQPFGGTDLTKQEIAADLALMDVNLVPIPPSEPTAQQRILERMRERSNVLPSTTAE